MCTWIVRISTTHLVMLYRCDRTLHVHTLYVLFNNLKQWHQKCRYFWEASMSHFSVVLGICIIFAWRIKIFNITAFWYKYKRKLDKEGQKRSTLFITKNTTKKLYQPYCQAFIRVYYCIGQNSIQLEKHFFIPRKSKDIFLKVHCPPKSKTYLK